MSKYVVLSKCVLCKHARYQIKTQHSTRVLYTVPNVVWRMTLLLSPFQLTNTFFPSNFLLVKLAIAKEVTAELISRNFLSVIAFFSIILWKKQENFTEKYFVKSIIL